jgi:hypothetical protein
MVTWDEQSDVGGTSRSADAHRSRIFDAKTKHTYVFFHGSFILKNDLIGLWIDLKLARCSAGLICQSREI